MEGALSRVAVMLYLTILYLTIRNGNSGRRLLAYIPHAQQGRDTRAFCDERGLAFLEEAESLADLLDFGPAIAGMHVTGI